jgi:hypothetical protein
MGRRWAQTRREKLGQVDGINLFFGALLGANLGTVGTMPLFDYVQIILLLSGMVMTIRMVASTDRRYRAAATVTLYVALVVAILLIPDLQPSGLSPADLQRLVATLAIWFAATMLVEFWPTREESDA